MYKNLFLIAIAALLFTACSNEDEFEGSTNNSPIGFDTYVGKQTRAAATTSDNLKEFGVYAYVTANTAYPLMDNEKISTADNGASWTYSNIKYWPENDNVDFFAYAPYKSGWTDYSSADKSFEYTVPASVSAQEDLVGATAFQKNKGSNANKVNLVFKHLLSKIGFSAKSDKDYSPAIVTVTGLEVLYNADAIDSKSTFIFASSGDSGANVEAGSWTSPASAQLAAGTSGELITNSVIMTDQAKDLNTFSSPATAPDTYLMMLPQNVANGDIKAKITYTVTYTNPGAVVTNVKEITLPAVEWLMGKSYTYNFTIGLSQIVFDGITVSDWVNGSTQPAPTPVP